MTDPEFWEVGASGRRYSTRPPRYPPRDALAQERRRADWKVLYHQGTLVEPQP